MKKLIGATVVVLGLFSAQAMAGDGPNPCKWEHDPQPAYCKEKRDHKVNKIVPVKREKEQYHRHNGGDR